jgi:hypothetical protein
MRAFTARVGRHPFVALQIGLLAGVSLILRLWNLGYSNYQGDEIKAFCRASDFSTVPQFLFYLLQQRKGPVQFVTTCLYSLFDPGFLHAWAARLPFALASLLAMIFFLLLIWRLFRLQVAIYASFLFAVDGILIGQARSVQYQPFVILGILGGLLGMTLAMQSDKWRIAGLYLGFFAAAVGLLAHFDAAFALPPMAVLLVYWWRAWRRGPDFRRLRLHLLAALLLYAALVLPFYLEYLIHLSPSQTGYWGGLIGGETTPFLRLMKLYNPGPFVWVCLAALIAGLTRIRNTTAWQVTLAWLLPPLLFMTVIVRESGTHAYVYLLPVFVVAGAGIDALVRGLAIVTERLNIPRVSWIFQALLIGMFLGFSYISQQVFVDHTPEYPWFSKAVLGMTLREDLRDALLGFPYSRDWQAIGSWFAELPGEKVTLVSNEKQEIASFYLPSKVNLLYRLSDYPGKIKAPEGVYFLIVQGPQSGQKQLWGWPTAEWQQRLMPVHEFLNADRQVIASVYFVSQEMLNPTFR